MICLVDKGKTVDVIYLDFTKVFVSVSHNILMEKLVAHGFDRYALHRIKSCLDIQAQRMAVEGVKSSW